MERLRTDFFNKCYICEIKDNTKIEVEHFIPCKGDKKLQLDWNNLFLVCGHCNNTKLSKSIYDSILNCTNPEHDVINWIQYEIDEHEWKTVIKLSPIEDEKKNQAVLNTIELLKAVYNGIDTATKQAEASNLRKNLLDELLEFQNLTIKFKKEDYAYNKDDLGDKIKSALRKSSPFTAFKRWIVLKDDYLKQEFKPYFD